MPFQMMLTIQTNEDSQWQRNDLSHRCITVPESQRTHNVINNHHRSSDTKHQHDSMFTKSREVMANTPTAESKSTSEDCPKVPPVICQNTVHLAFHAHAVDIGLHQQDDTTIEPDPCWTSAISVTQGFWPYWTGVLWHSTQWHMRIQTTAIRHNTGPEEIPKWSPNVPNTLLNGFRNSHSNRYPGERYHVEIECVTGCLDIASDWHRHWANGNEKI